jgi:hypothetical protein
MRWEISITTDMSCSISRIGVPVLGLDRLEEGGEVGPTSRGLRPAARLVQAQQHGLRAHGARDLEPALGAVGQVAGRIVGALD